MKEKKQPNNPEFQKLPSYDPDDDLWGAIQKDLNGERWLRAAIRKLPIYVPPKKVWQEVRRHVQPKRVSLQALQTWKTVAVAAVFLLSVSLAFMFLPLSGEEVRISYSEQTILESDLAALTAEDEAVFARVDEWCKPRPWVCNDPDYQLLQQELEDLENARSKLMKAIGPYPDDPDLVTLLSRIERDRSDVLKRMVAML